MPLKLLTPEPPLLPSPLDSPLLHQVDHLELGEDNTLPTLLRILRVILRWVMQLQVEEDTVTQLVWGGLPNSSRQQAMIRHLTFNLVLPTATINLSNRRKLLSNRVGMEVNRSRVDTDSNNLRMADLRVEFKD